MWNSAVLIFCYSLFFLSLAQTTKISVSDIQVQLNSILFPLDSDINFIESSKCHSNEWKNIFFDSKPVPKYRLLSWNCFMFLENLSAMCFLWKFILFYFSFPFRSSFFPSNEFGMAILGIANSKHWHKCHR